jgi:hypothetical protein
MRPPHLGQRSASSLGGWDLGGSFTWGSSDESAMRARIVARFPDADIAGEEAVMANAMEAFRQHVRQEAANELRRGERHGFVAARSLDAVILEHEGHTFLIGRDEAPVGEGDAVGVAGKIGQHSFWPGQQRLSILPIITKSRSATPTIRCTGKGARSCGRRTQKGNAIFV